MYKVNVYILNKRPGDIVTQADSNFDVFKVWAERKDTRNGMVICEEYIVETEDASEETVEVEEPATYPMRSEEKKQYNFKKTKR